MEYLMSFSSQKGVYATTTATATRTAKKQKGLDKQNNNFARASRFFVYFSSVVARLQLAELSNFTFCGGREQKMTTFFFFFSEL